MTNGWKKTVEKPKKRGAIRLGALCLLVAAAGFLLWSNGYFGRGGAGVTEEPKVAAATEAPLEKTGESRTSREVAYDKDINALTLLSQNENVDAQTREDAARQLRKMVEAHQVEVAIEDALLAAGFSPCLALLQNGALTVMVETKELTSAQSAVILSLCAAHTDVGIENIRIMLGKK